MSLTREDLRDCIALAYTQEINAHKQLDPDLANTFIDMVWDKLHPPNLGCATNAELAAEIEARKALGHTGPYYRTVGTVYGG